jgi:hypothetical protein
MPKNVQKRPLLPSRPTAKPDDDHELGLWIDYELLRKHRNPTSTILHDPSAATNSRYLQLADLALGNGKARKKYKTAASK